MDIFSQNGYFPANVFGETLLRYLHIVGTTILEEMITIYGILNVYAETHFYAGVEFDEIPTCSVAATLGSQLTNKTYVDIAVSGATSDLLGDDNIWTGHNTYNTHLPTSSIDPVDNNELTNKSYVDEEVSDALASAETYTNNEIDDLLEADNTWEGKNTFTDTVTISNANFSISTAGAHTKVVEIGQADYPLLHCNIFTDTFAVESLTEIALTSTTAFSAFAGGNASIQGLLRSEISAGASLPLPPPFDFGWSSALTLYPYYAYLQAYTSTYITAQTMHIGSYEASTYFPYPAVCTTFNLAAGAINIISTAGSALLEGGFSVTLASANNINLNSPTTTLKGPLTALTALTALTSACNIGDNVGSTSTDIGGASIKIGTTTSTTNYVDILANTKLSITATNTSVSNVLTVGTPDSFLKVSPALLGTTVTIRTPQGIQFFVGGTI